MITPATTSRRHLLTTLATVPVGLLVAGRQSRGGPAAIVARFRRAYQALDDIALEDVLAPNLRFEDPTFHLKFDTFDAMRPLIADVKRTTRAVEVEVEHEMVCGDWVIARQKQIVFRTVAPEKPVVVRGVSLFRVSGDRIVEWFDYYDAVGYRQQIGGVA